MLFDWDCNISNLVTGCSRIGIGGGVTGLDGSPCVSLDIGLRLCVEVGRIGKKGLTYLLSLNDAFSTHSLMHAH